MPAARVLLQRRASGFDDFDWTTAMMNHTDKIDPDELNAALAAAAAAHTYFMMALMEFGRRFPGDHRRFGTEAGMDSERTEFEVAQGRVSALRREADAAQARWDQCRQASK